MSRILPLLLGLIHGLVGLPLAMAQSPAYGDLACTGEGQGTGLVDDIGHVSSWSRTATGAIDSRFEASQSKYDELLRDIRYWSDNHLAYTGTSVVARQNPLAKDLKGLDPGRSLEEAAGEGTEMLPSLPEPLQAELRALVTKDYLAARYGQRWRRSAASSRFDPAQERWYRDAMTASNAAASAASGSTSDERIESLVSGIEETFAGAQAHYASKPVHRGRKGSYVVMARDDRQWNQFRRVLRTKLTSLREASDARRRAELDTHQAELGDALRRAFAGQTAGGQNIYSLPPAMLEQVDNLRRMAVVAGSTYRAEDQFEEGKGEGYKKGYSEGEDSVSCSES